jgi:hypothetical protein
LFIRVMFKEKIKHIMTATEELFQKQLTRINFFTNISGIFKKADLVQKHAFLMVVFKQGKLIGR